MKEIMVKPTKNLLRYAAGAMVGVAVFAGVQFAGHRPSDFEVKPVTLDMSDVHLSPQAQLAQELADGHAFADKMVQNSVSSGKDGTL